MKDNSRGQSIVEFAMVLPFVALMVLAVVEVGLIGIRSVALQHGAFRAARTAEVYQGELADAELYAMLHPALFRGGLALPEKPGRKEMMTEALSKPVADLWALSPAKLMQRSSPQGAALPPGLSEGQLQGGDTPSPYCTKEGGYSVCGYPQ